VTNGRRATSLRPLRSCRAESGAIREQQADAEILIAWVQLAIVLLFSPVYAARR
jgi:hypothetical protein